MEIEAEAANNNDDNNAATLDIEKGLVVVEENTTTTTTSNGDEETITKGGETRRAVYLVWEEVSVLLPSFGKKHTKRVLDSVSGYALPARILAVMGPSGSGKSTLLDSLAGRLCGNLVMTGNVLLNGRKTNLDYGGVAYVTQDDIFLGTLTVRETIVYSAQLRLPSHTTKEAANDIIEATILEMGLQDCADTIIGNWHSRGISGGEKKRLSIALEILTQPQLLFLDEPTSGLDSASAFFVTQVLKNVACGGGKTVVSSVHQPSSEVFALFDDLLLLSGGETVYFGEARLAMEFFADSGFPCPSRRSPSDHFLRCTNSDFDEVNLTLKQSRRISDIDKSCAYLEKLSTTEIKGKLIQKYKWSNYAMAVATRIQEIKAIVSQKGFQTEISRGSHAGWFKQLTTLTERSFKNMSRDFGYYWLRIVVYILLSICVGTVFHDVGTNYHAILARGACGGFISGFMTFMAIGGFPCFIEEMKIFTKERLKGHYGVAVFILSNFMSSFPFLFMISLSSSSITYYTAKFRPGLFHFAYAVLDLLLSICIVESCMMVVASFVPNFLMGLIIGAGFIGIMMATAGFFRLLPQLPKPFWRYPISYINFMSWGLQGAYKNDMIGIEFDGINPGDPKLKGEYIIKNMLGFSIQHSKWWDLTVVFLIFLAYRMLFYIVLKLKEKGYPMFRSIYTKQTIQHLSKRASFRKVPPFTSKRHQTIPTLSSQDGFDSPIHCKSTRFNAYFDTIIKE